MPYTKDKINKGHHAELKRRWHQEVRRPRIIALRKEVQDYKSNLGCSHCNENHPACLDFHHIDPSRKTGYIGLMIGQGVKRELIFEEISQCIVLCSNCHRKEHWKPDLVV